LSESLRGSICKFVLVVWEMGGSQEPNGEVSGLAEVNLMSPLFQIGKISLFCARKCFFFCLVLGDLFLYLFCGAWD
jgi:hypothetical protein